MLFTKFYFLINYLFYFTILYWFCHTLTWICQEWVYMCSPSWTPLPPLSPYHLSGSSQCTSPKHPVSCIKPGLAIDFTYDILHVSMPFSQIIPCLPSPTESKRLFNTSVSLLLSRIQGYHYLLPNSHIYALVYCIGVFLSGLFHFTTKETISKVKRQPSEWEEIIANEVTDKELISKIYKQLLQLNSRKIKDPIKKWGTRVHPWQIHVDVWQNQYNIVK